MVVTLEKIYSIKEYFQVEQQSEIRYEFVEGKLIPMAGESKLANKIASNILVLLYSITSEKALEIFTHAVRLQVERGKRYRYPDLMIAPIVDDKFPNMVTQPVLIVEVLSKSTANEDTTSKVEEYCQIETLQHYLIINQDKKQVQMYSRFQDKWLFEIINNEDSIINLTALNTTLPLSQIYKKIF